VAGNPTVVPLQEQMRFWRADREVGVINLVAEVYCRSLRKLNIRLMLLIFGKAVGLVRLSLRFENYVFFFFYYYSLIINIKWLHAAFTVKDKVRIKSKLMKGSQQFCLLVKYCHIQLRILFVYIYITLLLMWGISSLLLDLAHDRSAWPQLK